MIDAKTLEAIEERVQITLDTLGNHENVKLSDMERHITDCLTLLAALRASEAKVRELQAEQDDVARRLIIMDTREDICQCDADIPKYVCKRCTKRLLEGYEK